MASIKSINFLPQIFRSDANEKFINATLDQLTSEPDFVKVAGYIGRRDTPAYNPGDTYISESSSLRSDYQLEPAVSVSDNNRDVQLFSSYPDLLQRIVYNGGITNNHSRLFANQSYNFNSLIDLDKFVNFHKYLWMPNGPPEVAVSAFASAPIYKFTVNRDKTAPGYVFTGTKDANPALTLIRGETYTFKVNQSGQPFYIQAKPGLNLGTEALRLDRQIYGLTNNGQDLGTITFAVPYKDAQSEFTEAPLFDKVDFAVDAAFTSIHKHSVKELEKSGALDGITGSLDGRTLIFAKQHDNPHDWEDPGIFDFEPFEDGTVEAFSGGVVPEASARYNMWRVRVKLNTLGEELVYLEPYKTVPIGYKVTIKQGVTYAGVDFKKNEAGIFEEVPVITAPLDVLYYQDGQSGDFAGEFKIVDPDSSTINVATEILGKTNFTSPNGVRFTNGLVVRFDNTVTPASYKNNLFVVEGVGTGITLVGAGNYVNPEDYAVADALATPDYITIDRSSFDLNAWTRANRWFHEELIELSAKYNNDPTILLTAENYKRAQRPIIEFDPDIYLFQHGSAAKAMVDILDFTITNAFKQVEGQEAFTIQLPNGNTKHLTAGMRIIFAGDQDPDVRSRIYLVQFITTSKGSQIHLVSQNTEFLPTYTVSDHVILENKAYSFVPTITYSSPYPAIGAATASANVVLNTTTVKSIDVNYGGINYIPGVKPSLKVNTAYTKAVKADFVMQKHTAVEFMRIVNAGLGYTETTTVTIDTPNFANVDNARYDLELISSVEYTENAVDYATVGGTSSRLVVLDGMPSDFNEQAGTYVIGEGIPGGTTAQIITSNSSIYLDRTVSVLAGKPIIFAQSSVATTETAYKTSIITVDDTSNVSAGMYISGGKPVMTISAITTGATARPPIVTVTTEHGLVNGDLVRISDISQFGPADLNGFSFYIKVVDATSFALYTDANLANPYDATQSNPFVEDTGIVSARFIDYDTFGTRVKNVLSATQLELTSVVTLDKNTDLVFAGRRATAQAKIVNGTLRKVYISDPGAGYSKDTFDLVTATVADLAKSAGPSAVIKPIQSDDQIDYINITDAGLGYVIGSDVTVEVIDTVEDTTTAVTAGGSTSAVLTFANTDQIKYINNDWKAFLVLEDGIYADFARTPYLNERTGPNDANFISYADVGMTSSTEYTVIDVDLTTNQVTLSRDLDVRDHDGEIIDLPIGSKIVFTAKNRYFTDSAQYNGAPIGSTRAGYIVKNARDYTLNGATSTVLELELTQGLQVGMILNDAGLSYGNGIKVVAIDSYTNQIYLDRQIAINAGTPLTATSQPALTLTLTPATIASIDLIDAGAEYTSAPVVTIEPTTTPVTHIISSEGGTSGEVTVNSLSGIEIGSVVTSDFQNDGYGITTGGDVIRVLSTRTAIAAGGTVTYKVKLGVARYFTLGVTTTATEYTTDAGDVVYKLVLPNVIGIEDEMTLDDDLGSFSPTTVYSVDVANSTVYLRHPIIIAEASVLRFYRVAAQPVFGDVFATFRVAARIAATVASSNVVSTVFNDTTPETYEVGDTVLVGTATNPLQTSVNVETYNQFYAVLVGTTVKWVPAQKKYKYNQEPRFDMFDESGYSLGDQTVYSGSKFAGTKIIAYDRGTGANDTVLGFPLAYKNFQNQGDIKFVNHILSDSFTYLKNNIETSLDVRGYDLRIRTAAGTSKRVNQWTPIKEKTKQFQVISWDFNGKNSRFRIDLNPSPSNTMPYMKVYFNNKLVPETDWTTEVVGGFLALQLSRNILKTSQTGKVDIYIYNNSVVSKRGHYELPVNYEVNPFNSVFDSITLGQMRNHLVTMTENHYGMTGSALGRNNLRDLDYKTWQGSLLQHASPAIFSSLFMVDKNADLVSAIQLSSREYTKFKNRVLDTAAKLDLMHRDPVEDLDRVLASVMAGKTPQSAWYASDMLPYGTKKTETTLPIIDAQRRRYEIPEIFNDTVLSHRAVIVYLQDANGVKTMLVKDQDFVFEKSVPAITLSDTLETPYTSQIVLVDYDTRANYIPETPTKLGLYPKFKPAMYLDDTYQTPTMVIQGHDGSIIPAFNDYRDDLLMEMEMRIYNNIKVSYDASIFDMYDLIPGKFRETSYTRIEFNNLLTKSFLKWVGNNKVDYQENTYFQANNPWTWTYNNFQDVVNGEYLPGFWRGIYKHFFDTDRPHTHPWEMLGFSEMPTWWIDTYGPAPYTGGNLLMWQHLEEGYIAGGTRQGYDTRFARRNLSKFIPVDDTGTLISPEKIVLRNYNGSQVSDAFSIGDVGPIEAAWRRSSDFPFAVQTAMALGYPGYYCGTLQDVSRYTYDSELAQYVRLGTNERISPTTVAVPDSGMISGTETLTAGYLNWVVESMVNRGVDGTAYVTNLLKRAEMTLAYRMGGFSDKKYLTMLADQSSPGSTNASVVVPDQNYRITLNKGTPVLRVVYSAVIVEKISTGYTVSGYDLSQPYFTIIPSDPTGNAYNIKVLEESAPIYKDYQKIKIDVPYGTEFHTKKGVVDFLNSYQRYLRSQGFTFEEFVPELGRKLDFIMSAEEFLMWSQQGWDAGSMLVLSPAFNQLTFENQAGVIDQVENSLTSTKLLDQNYNMIKSNQYSVTRADNSFGIKALSGQTIGLAEFSLVQYEHVMLFDNTTVFNDVMYTPELGIRQGRLKMVGSKTANWTGQLNPGGLIYNSDKIDAWKPGTTYRQNSLVLYKGTAYAAKENIDAANDFQFLQWQPLDKDQIKTGMLPNWATNADTFEHIYDIDGSPVDETIDAFSHGLIGFRERSYLTDFSLDAKTQAKFYQGFIKQKGSQNAITALTNAQFSNITNTVNVYEDWALRVGEYGALGSDQYVDIKLEDTKFTENPTTVALINAMDTPIAGVVNVVPNEVYAFTDTEYSTQLINTRSVSDARISDIVTAGYPRIDDVDNTLFDIRDTVTASKFIDKVGAGYKLWVAKDFNSQWNVYRMTETESQVVQLDYQSDTSMTVNTDAPHNLVAGDVIALINFDADANGFYEVVSVLGNNSFSVDTANTQLVTRLRRAQSIVGTGIMFEAVSVRFKQINELLNFTPKHQWRPTDRVWVDNDTGTGQWAVYGKNDSWTFLSPTPLRNEDTRPGEGYGSTVKLSTDNSLMLVGAPAHSEGSVRGIRVLSAGKNYTTPAVGISLTDSDNGTSATVSTVTLSTGELVNATLSSAGTAVFQRPPTVTITDANTAVISSYYAPVTFTGLGTNPGVGGGNIIEVDPESTQLVAVGVGDYLLYGSFGPTATHARVTEVNLVNGYITFDVSVAAAFGQTISIVRALLNTVVFEDQANVVAATTQSVVNSYQFTANTVAGLTVEDILEGGAYTRANRIRVLAVNSSTGNVSLSAPVNITSGTKLNFLKRFVFDGDTVENVGTVSNVSIVDPTRVTFTLPVTITEAQSVDINRGSNSGNIAAYLTSTTIATIEVINGGSGFAASNPPTIRITGGGGAGAIASAVVVGGAITSVTIVDAGSGYETEPTVTVIPTNNGTPATLRAKLTASPVHRLIIKSSGTNYRYPKLSFSSPTSGSGLTGYVDATYNSISALTVVDVPGSGYLSVPTVTATDTAESGLAHGTGAVLEPVFPTGTVRCFSRADATSDSMMQVSSIHAPTPDIREMGAAIDMGTSLAAIGAPGTYEERGLVTIYQASNAQWSIHQLIAHPDGADAAAGARFGATLALSRNENWLYIGAPGESKVYAYSKFNSDARQVVINVTPNNINYYHGFVDLLTADELRVFGDTGRVYQADVDYVLENFSIRMITQVPVTDSRIYITRLAPTTTITPTRTAGIVDRVYTLNTVPGSADSLAVVGGSGSAYLAGRDWELVGKNQIRFIRNEFIGEASISVFPRPFWYSLVDVIEGDSGFGTTIATNREGYQVAIGAPNKSKTVDGTVYPQVGKVFVYDRSYEKTVVQNTTGLTNLTLAQVPLATTRVMLDRSELTLGVDYTIASNNIAFTRAVPYGSAIKVDTNRFNLLQEIDPPEVVAQEKFGYTLDISEDNLTLVVGAPGYRSDVYYNGAVYRYINQTQAYGKANSGSLPTIASSGTLRFNDVQVAFSPITYDGIYTTITSESVAHSINSANIVGLSATGYTDVFHGDVTYPYDTVGNHVYILSGIPDSNTFVRVDDTELVLDTDYSFSYNSLTGKWSITLISALTTGHFLFVQNPVSFALTKGSKSLSILPGTNLKPSDLGFDTFVLTQTFTHPNKGNPEKYGSKVKLDETGEVVLIASEGGTTVQLTTYDKTNTTIDRDSTRFLDSLVGAGAVYVYDYLPILNESLENPGEFLYNQVLQNSYINFNDNFGGAIDINNGWILAGADRYDNTTLGLNNSGLVHVFRNPTLSKGWTRKRTQTAKVDIDFINNAMLYDTINQVSVTQLDYVDPVKGKILGVADQDIDYKTSYDPAYYNKTTRADVTADTTSPWSTVQVGSVWWNLDTCRYIDYEQGELTYRSQNWGKLFPGSSIEVLEWTESTVPPSKYAATYKDGTPKHADDSAYTQITSVEAATGIVKTMYYFWVTGKREIGKKATRNNSIITIASNIADPANSGQPFIAVLAPNAFSFYGVREFVKSKNTAFRIEYAKVKNQNIKHNEFQLVAQNDPMSDVPTSILNKLIDSLAGENSYGQLVPDPYLLPPVSLGIEIRPRQSMIKDQSAALLNLVAYINDFFAKNQVANFNISRLKAADPVPAAGLYQGTVTNYESLTYIDRNILFDGYKILVEADETNNNFWAIYRFVNSTDSWFLDQIQSYDATRYWKYVDWYADGYTSKTKINKYLPRYQDLQKIVLVAGEVIRVANNGSGEWEMYVVNADLTTTKVGLQNGTIEFNAIAYNNIQNQVGYDTGGFDTVGFGKTPSKELRNMLEGMFYDVLTGVYSNDLNDLFFTMVAYILSEQKMVDWLLKTSFVSIVHERDQLREIVKYTADNQSYYEDYISEVKPYRTEIKEYLLDYTALDKSPAMVSDYDFPAIYDQAQAKYRTLNPADNEDLALIRASASDNWLGAYSYGIQSIDIVDGGSGYINPVVTFTSPTGVDTTAEVESVDGAITSITITDGGSNYTDIPVVDITGSVGTGFSGKVTMGVASASVVDGGSNYSVGDIITYTDETGSAVFSVTKVVSGAVAAVNVSSHGEFTTTSYQAVATDTTGLGSGATFNLTYRVVKVAVVDAGKNYITTAPRVVIGGGGGTGAKAHVVVKDGKITRIIMDAPGSGYTSTPNVTFAGGRGTGARAYARLVQAAGTAVTYQTQNKQIRSIKTSMKFDRIAYTTSVSRWKPYTTYHANDVLVVPDTVTKTYVNVPDQILPRRDVAYQLNKTLLASETFDPNKLIDTTLFTPLSGADLQNAIDRLGAYLRPGSPNFGKLFGTTDLKLLTEGSINTEIISVDNSWNAVAHSGTVPATHEYRWAAVGDRSTIATSTDGVNWKSADMRDTNVNLHAVTFVNGTTWVAIGNNGTTFTSTDGVSWDRTLIDSYYYNPTPINVTGEVFTPAASVVDLVGATTLFGTYGDYVLAVGSKGLVLMNSYGSESQLGDRWISARVPNELIDIQFITTTSKDFGVTQNVEVNGTNYTLVSYDGASADYGVKRLASGYTAVSSAATSLALQKGLVAIGGVNGYIYFASVQDLEDLHNGYYRGYNFENGRGLNPHYPWVQTVVPQTVMGTGDGASGEHISGIAIGDAPDTWVVAVGAGGTLLWNSVDMFFQSQPGTTALAADTIDSTTNTRLNIVNHSVDVFINWREFDASNFAAPLLKSDIANENFTSVAWDGDKFVAVTDTNLIFWGYPGSKASAYFDISSNNPNIEASTYGPTANWTGASSVTSRTITFSQFNPDTAAYDSISVAAALTNIPTVGMVVIGLVDAGNNAINAVVTAVNTNNIVVSFATATVAQGAHSTLTFVYGTTGDINAGDTVTARSPDGTVIEFTVAYDVARGGSRIHVTDYNKVAQSAGSNWSILHANLPIGAKIKAVGKFANFTWELAPGSKRSNTRGFTSVASDTTIVSLSSAVKVDMPIGTLVTFFDATGTRYPHYLTQVARAGSKLITVANNIDILPGFVTPDVYDETGTIVLLPSATVVTSRQYVLGGVQDHVEKDITDHVPGTSYRGVHVTGQAFTDNSTDPDYLDTQILSSFTDSELGSRPEDIIIDGGKFIDVNSSHAPEELVPGIVQDLLQMTVFTKDPNSETGAISTFKIFADQKNPASYYRISAAYSTTLAKDLGYADTEVYVADISKLPDPNPAANLPGTVFINGEKIIYLEIDRTAGKLMNIRRGGSRTSIPLVHAAGSVVTDASDTQLFDRDFETPLTADLTVSNQFGTTATYLTATTATITQGRIWLDLGT